LARFDCLNLLKIRSSAPHISRIRRVGFHLRNLVEMQEPVKEENGVGSCQFRKERID
jgi:hypothetical protein